MQQIRLYDFYELGKALQPIHALKRHEDIPLSDIMWALYVARYQLRQAVAEPSVLLVTSRRAAAELIREINQVIPEKDEDLFGADQKEVVGKFRIGNLKDVFERFETVLSNDMPDMATFAVMQIGIYRTDDLIDRAHKQIASGLQKYLPHDAQLDIVEAGRCLAFRVATASAFHMWRALETVMGHYHVALTGKTFRQANVTRNWADYIKALKAAGAPDKITKHLDHIRSEYRNPINHPEMFLATDEAFGLFGAGLSALGQLLSAMAEIQQKKEADSAAQLALGAPATGTT